MKNCARNPAEVLGPYRNWNIWINCFRVSATNWRTSNGTFFYQVFLSMPVRNKMTLCPTQKIQIKFSTRFAYFNFFLFLFFFLFGCRCVRHQVDEAICFSVVKSKVMRFFFASVGPKNHFPWVTNATFGGKWRGILKKRNFNQIWINWNYISVE